VGKVCELDFVTFICVYRYSVDCGCSRSVWMCRGWGMYRDTHTHVICVCMHSLEEVECIPLKGECVRQELYTTDNGILHAMMDYTEIRCRGSISDRHSCVSCVTETRCQRCKWKWSRRSLCVEEDKTTCGQMRIDLNERSLLSKRVYRRGMHR
jgi:hypothetical protein